MPNMNSFRVRPLTEDGMLENYCDKGHKSFFVLQNEKFEILSELAVRALAAGNSRDGIANFASSLERLHEFFIRVSALKNKVPQAVLEAAWKKMANASERQLGAFIFAFMAETGRCPPLLSESTVKIRNGVVHKGDIPAMKVAFEFCQAVADCALSIMEVLKSVPLAQATSDHQQLILADKHRKARSLSGSTNNSGGGLVTPLCLMTSTQGMDVAAKAQEYAARPQLFNELRDVGISSALAGDRGR